MNEAKIIAQYIKTFFELFDINVKIENSHLHADTIEISMPHVAMSISNNVIIWCGNIKFQVESIHAPNSNIDQICNEMLRLYKLELHRLINIEPIITNRKYLVYLHKLKLTLSKLNKGTI